MHLEYGFVLGKNALFAYTSIEKCSNINKTSASSIVQLQNASIFIEKAVWSNLTMFVTDILEKIVIHFSVDMIRTFASFSVYTLSIEAQTNRRVKRPNIGDLSFRSDESLAWFMLQGR